MMKKTKPKYSIGIDIGSGRSAFSIFLLENGKSTPFCNTNWQGKDDFYGLENENTYSKDTTALLYRKEGCQLVCWGTKALLEYAKMDVEKQRLHFIATNFKTQMIDVDGLYKVQENGELKPLEPLEGKVQVKVLDLVVDILKQLYKEALAMLKEKAPAEIDEVLVVVSLPALHADNFEFMVSQYRKAMKKAGLGEALLVLEPKAATISAFKDGYLKKDGIIIMMDSGAGTSDSMSSRVTGNVIESIENVQPTSEFSGSTFVDRRFWERLYKISPLLLKSLREEKMTEYIKICAAWERAKCQFDPSSSLPNYKVKIGSKNFIKKLVEDIPDLFDHLNEDGEICFSREEMLSFFAPTLNAIVLQVKNQINNLTSQGLSCDDLVFVGGYALSKCFRQRMQKEFGSDMCNFPDKDGSAVLKGAAWFGAEPDIYRRPLAPYTYGFKTASRFDSALDASYRGQIEIKYKNWFGWEWTESEKFISELSREHLCKDRFDIKVEAGKSVDRIFAPSVYSPVSLNQEVIPIEIYKSSKSEIRYVDDPSCTKIGTVTIKRDNNCSVRDWQVMVSIRFHQDQIEVTAIDLHSNKECTTKIEFTPIYKEFDT